MEKRQDSETSGALQVVTHLVEAARIDTVCRDLYLERALPLFEPLLSRQEYLYLKQGNEEVASLVRRSQAAVERGDWELARELTVRIRELRGALEQKGGLMELGSEIHEPAQFHLDPFSPGLQLFAAAGGRRREDLRARLVAHLSALESADSALDAFYRERRERFERLAVGTGKDGAPAAAPTDLSRIQQDALQAVERGDVEHLDRLLARLSGTPAAVAPGGEAAVSREAGDLSAPFPEEAAERGGALGLSPVRLEPAAEVSAFLMRWAWQPSFPDLELTREGGLKILGLSEQPDFPADYPDRLRELIDLFVIHPFVNSCGARYLPRLAEEEILVEAFAEGEDPPASELLSLLGLARRRSLSRLEIETALVTRGPRVVREHLGLDPRAFRLVSIPFDAYFRIGAARGWGEQRLWTHFDGYQLLKDGGLRALVGGDVRYGGIFDLCSIGPADEREGVVARFAVVRRERLAAA